MALDDDIFLLSQTPLFSNMNKEQLKVVASGLQHRIIKSNNVLFLEKSPAESAYVVMRGKLELSKKNTKGVIYEKNQVSSRSLLAELALITLIEHQYTATAMEDSEILRIPRKLFHKLLKEYPQVSSIIQKRIRNNIISIIESCLVKK
ncbi:putative cAMP-dependent kinase protein [Liberibacter crescens BT-1]|uniref:Putative cAMP-dependent kinase protein n=1 Tax=Liberibacter crescens (strain BT-1) TaxID=1215343 RepID=L0ESV6_LIBCB|nr:cyclic nucleotide-binding domain-containing protein [Liberibacter crescens]AGA64007.1 putative cAMP-dependent kinase protein [Liberibacter crescens BT-1]AMC12317.1 protein kinase [Liberibacter crescens]